MKSAFRDQPTPPRHELHPQSPWGSGLTPRAIEEAPRSLNSLLCPKGGPAEREAPAQLQLKAVQAPPGLPKRGSLVAAVTSILNASHLPGGKKPPGAPTGVPGTRGPPRHALTGP